MFGIHILGVIAVFLAFWFLAMAGGGLDIMNYGYPGLSGTCTMLPFAILLTFFTIVKYPKPKEHDTVKWLLIFTAALNVILAVQVIIVVFTYFGI